jgi:DNA-binding LacI/PurR family transcriptional regulator/DNA-binding transcriptional regulator YhcF (GntR family)
MTLKLLSHVEQITEYLRNEIKRGRWGESMPGGFALKDQLGTSHNTVELALKQLEKEGFLIAQGAGKSRRIVIPKDATPGTLRVAIFNYETEDKKVDYLLDLLHQLRVAGHSSYFASKSLTELGMDPKKVASFVSKNKADAWVVCAGSRPILEWFASQPFPVFGLFGRVVNLPIASTRPLKLPALRQAVEKLISLGHRRIVFMTRGEHRKPSLGTQEQEFLKVLQEHGIPTGSYNLPDWEETRAGYRRAIDSLFAHTPPTAILMDTSLLMIGALQHFARLGIQAPRDVSLVCMDPDLTTAWCDPLISHISYDSDPWIRHVVRWANNVARGKDDKSKSQPLAKFIEGGTIGPAPGTK